VKYTWEPLENITSRSLIEDFHKRKRAANVVKRRKAAGKRRRNRVLQEIKRLQRSTNLIIPAAAFSRLVRETIADFYPRHSCPRVAAEVVPALQTATESFLTDFFRLAMQPMAHAGRATLMASDMKLTLVMLEESKKNLGENH